MCSSPSAAKVEHARRVIEAFEEGLRKGRASVTLDDRMVDTPVYKQAKLALERAEAVAAVERTGGRNQPSLGKNA